jgi:hypothetical protein
MPIPVAWSSGQRVTAPAAERLSSVRAGLSPIVDARDRTQRLAIIGDDRAVWS